MRQLQSSLLFRYYTAYEEFSGMFYLMACNPEVQERLRDELEDRFGTADEDIEVTQDDLNSLAYLDQV